MDFEYDPIYGKKKKYIVTYKDDFGKECTIEGEASSKTDAERLFRLKFGNWCEIIKTQTSEEWIKETAENIAEGLMKHIKKDLGQLVSEDKKSVIDPKKAKKIDYKSKSFLNGLRKVKEEIERSQDMRVPDNEKMYLR